MISIFLINHSALLVVSPIVTIVVALIGSGIPAIISCVNNKKYLNSQLLNIIINKCDVHNPKDVLNTLRNNEEDLKEIFKEWKKIQKK